jgi:hypothetical protein
VLTNRLRAALVVLAASAGLAGCTSFGPYGGIGVGVGSGYGGYGYDPYYAGYGSGYGYSPYYGWYNGFYYPGTGYWVYDPDRNRREMTPEERAYWRARFQARFGEGAPKENWEGFGTIARKSSLAKSTAPTSAAATTSATATGQADERSLRQIAEARRQRQETVRTERQQARSERQETTRQQVIERREARRTPRSPSE